MALTIDHTNVPHSHPRHDILKEAVNGICHVPYCFATNNQGGERHTYLRFTPY